MEDFLNFDTFKIWEGYWALDKATLELSSLSQTASFAFKP